MHVKLHLIICHEAGHEETVTDVITLNKRPGQRLPDLSNKATGVYGH